MTYDSWMGSAVIPTKLGEAVLSNARINLAETDLPLLQTTTGKTRYPLRDMLVGQHFFVPNNGRTTEKTQNAVTSSVHWAARRYGFQYHQRRYATGIRVWKVGKV